MEAPDNLPSVCTENIALIRKQSPGITGTRLLHVMSFCMFCRGTRLRGLSIRLCAGRSRSIEYSMMQASGMVDANVASRHSCALSPGRETIMVSNSMAAERGLSQKAAPAIFSSGRMRVLTTTRTELLNDNDGNSFCHHCDGAAVSAAPCNGAGMQKHVQKLEKNITRRKIAVLAAYASCQAGSSAWVRRTPVQCTAHRFLGGADSSQLTFCAWRARRLLRR